VSLWDLDVQKVHELTYKSTVCKTHGYHATSDLKALGKFESGLYSSKPPVASGAS